MKHKKQFHSSLHSSRRAKHHGKSSQRVPSKFSVGSVIVGFGVITLSSSGYGQAVSLGEAENFAIVSSAGVTNSGFSIVNGNVALSPLITITGFNFSDPIGQGIVNGDVHYNDGQAMLAQSEGLIAYNTLRLLPYLPANDLTGMDLGGMTLAPGTYHFEESAQLTGNLTLATGSDSNAIYVFQVGSTLTTATYSSLIVTGAGADVTPNIFWQVGSSATLNTGTLFSGNILALSSISLGTDSQLALGRTIALTGAVTMLNNNITNSAAAFGASGRFWNGYAATNKWSENNWSSTDEGNDTVSLGMNGDVVFSIDPDLAINPAPQKQDTLLDTDVTISSLTVNDSVAVTIGGNNLLSISATGPITGININNGAGQTTIESNLNLGLLSQVITVKNTEGLLISGVIGGASGLRKTGTGGLTLTGIETYTGDTVVSNGTLQIGDGIRLGTSIASTDSVLIAQNGILAIKLANGEIFGNSVTDNGQIQWIAPGTNTQASTSVFSGTGSMLVTAPTRTVLLGNNTFSGGTRIDTPGSVFVGNPNSDTSSPFGSGVFTLNNGTFDTVDSQLLQVNVGGYEQTGGEISMHLEGAEVGDYTRFLVDGDVVLSGGTVFVYDLSGNYVPYGGDQQNIIHITEEPAELEGEFASNFPESRFYNRAFDVEFFYHQGDTLLYPTVTYDADNAYVTWVQDSFQSVPDLTPNQDAVGGGLDDIADSDPGLPDDVIAFLNGQDIDDLPMMYDLIAPDELTAIFQMGFSASEIQNANIRRHLNRVRQGSTSQGQQTYSSSDSKGGMVQETVMTRENNLWSFFVEGSGGSASVDGDFNSGGYEFDTMGLTVGADKRVSENLAIGIMGAYGKSDASLINGGNIDADGFKGAVYATAFKDGFFVDALLGAGVNSYETRRASLLGFAEGSPDGWELNAMLNTGYDFQRGNWTFTPTGSIAYTRVMLESFSETGSLTPLTFPDQHQDSLRSEIGARIAYTAMFKGMTITPQVRVAWQHEFMDSTQSMTSGFLGGNGQTFVVSGPHIGRDRVVVSAGISAQLTPTLCIYGFYDGQIGSSNYNSNQLSVGLKMDF